jgi:hypothetical protein
VPDVIVRTRFFVVARTLNVATSIGIVVSHLWFVCGYLYAAQALGRLPRRHIDDPKEFGICGNSSAVLSVFLAQLAATAFGLGLATSVLWLAKAPRPRSATLTLGVSIVSMLVWWLAPWVGWCLD